MAHRIQISLPPAPSDGRYSLARRLKRAAAGVGIVVLVLAIVVAALILGSVIAAAVAALLLAAVVVGVIRVILFRSRHGRVAPRGSTEIGPRMPPQS